MAGAPGDPFGWVGATADGKYLIEECVGEGGFGVVYRANHLGFGEKVAFKCLRVPDDFKGEDKDRFFESFLAEGKLQHRLSRMTAGIVQALDVGATTSPNGQWTPYLVLEWLQGRTLERDMDERHQLGMRGRPLHEALALLDPVARALDLAHEQGVAHRDVKPANLFLAEIGGRQTIKVLDFGIAKVITETASVSRAFEVTGRTLQAFTAHYGAPEQFARRFGATGPWTDVFALALVLIELVSGKRALEGEDAAELFVSSADSAHRPTLRARGVEVSEPVEEVFKVALSVDPRERFRTMGEFWDALCEAASWVPRAPMSSVHTAVLPADTFMPSPGTGSDVDALVPSVPRPDTPTTVDPAAPPAKVPEASTQLSSSTQVPMEAKPASVTRAPVKSGGVVLKVAAGSLALGAVVGGVAYLSARRAGPAPAALVQPAVSSAPVASAAPAPPPPGPLPPASASARVDAPRAAPFAKSVPAGTVPGTNVWVEEFRAQSLPGDTARGVLEAQTQCADAGLSLCTEQQWARACAENAEIGREPSWTLTAQTHGFVVRGGGACSIRAVAGGTSHAPDRHGLCCERSVAVETNNPNKNFVAATSRQLEKIEAALNSRRSSVFMGLVSDGAAIDGEPRTLAEIGKLLDESYQQHPDQWTIIDTCSVSMKATARPARKPTRTKRKPRPPESSSWSAECEVLRHRGGEISVVTTSYVIAGSGRLQSIDDIRVSRGWSKP
ncbi:MAG: protein kinase [Myxococcales bacterium]|nr:protein kinase [Myxococcales bacterium]